MKNQKSKQQQTSVHKINTKQIQINFRRAQEAAVRVAQQIACASQETGVKHYTR